MPKEAACVPADSSGGSLVGSVRACSSIVTEILGSVRSLSLGAPIDLEACVAGAIHGGAPNCVAVAVAVAVTDVGMGTGIG